MKKLSYILLLLALVTTAAVVQSCKKDPAVTDAFGEPEGPTPLQIEKPGRFPAIPSYPSNPLTVEGVALGRMLFYDSTLSGDYSMSCASCHKQANGFSDAPNRFSTGIDGLEGDRNSMNIFNLLWHEDIGFFWDGRASTLEEQAEAPVTNPIELHTTWEESVKRLQDNPLYPERFKKAFGSPVITKENAAKALAQFMRTIISSDSRYDKVMRGEAQFTAQEQKGFTMFFTEPKEDKQTGQRVKWTGLDCFHCHSDPLFLPEPGVPMFMDNGTGSKQKTPSLRNLVYTAPYMHDGRFTTLRQVIEHYDKGKGSDPNTPGLDENMFVKLHPDLRMDLAPDEVDALVAFLNTLNDETLLTNPDYGNPFKK